MYHLSHVFYSWTTKHSKEEGGSADASVVSAAARENHRFLGAVDLEERCTFENETPNESI